MIVYAEWLKNINSEIKNPGRTACSSYSVKTYLNDSSINSCRVVRGVSVELDFLKTAGKIFKMLVNQQNKHPRSNSKVYLRVPIGTHNALAV